MVVVETRNQTVVWYQGAYKQGDLAYKRNQGGSPNWDYMYCYMGHWVEVCFDQQNKPNQGTSLLLLEW